MLLIGTFGMGWLVDTIYSHYREDSDVDKLKVMEEFGKRIAMTLNESIAGDDFVTQWQSFEGEYHLELLRADNLALPPSLIKQLQNGELLLLESRDFISLHYYLPKKQQVLVIKLPIEKMVGNDENSINYFLTAFFYLALVLAMITWSYPLLIRLLRLRKVTHALGKGDLTQRIKLSRFSYIGDIESEFNSMANRLENLVSDVKMLSGAVSHDLRTPLARIQMGVDTLCEENDPKERRKYERKINKNITEMTALVETLLQYARLEQSMLRLSLDAVDFNKVLRDCLASIGSAKLVLDIEISERPLFINADEVYLKMAINNILDNAIKFGDGAVNVKLSSVNSFAHMSISDNGNGVETNQRREILKPFVRGNTEKSVGYGFGLAVVKRIIDWHNGDLEVTQCDVLCGAKIVIKMPLLSGKISDSL
jgi:two-component system OmpR family sensor kinase